DERERAGHDHDAEHRERERDLVPDELRAGAHRAEDRELRLGRPAADDEPVDPGRAEREDEDERDRDVRDLAVDVPVPEVPARATSTVAWSSSACSSAMRATPATRLLSMRARSRRDVPFERTSTSSPAAIPSRRASFAESCTSAAGRWKASSGTRSTAAPEKSGR